MRASGVAVSLVVSLACMAGAQVLKSRPLALPGGPSHTSEPAAVVLFMDPETVAVKASRPAQVDVHFHVIDGFHINSHAPLDKTLVPARLAVVEGPGLHVSAVDFPPGTDYVLQVAPHEKLSVYTGDLTLRVHLTASPGENLLGGALRYQACDANACMPPRSVPFQVTVQAR